MKTIFFLLTLIFSSAALSEKHIETHDQLYKRVQIRGNATIYFELETLNCTAEEVDVVTKEARNDGHFDLLFFDLSEYPGNESACVLKKANLLQSQKIRIEVKSPHRVTVILFPQEANLRVLED